MSYQSPAVSPLPGIWGTFLLHFKRYYFLQCIFTTTVWNDNPPSHAPYTAVYILQCSHWEVGVILTLWRRRRPWRVSCGSWDPSSWAPVCCRAVWLDSAPCTPHRGRPQPSRSSETRQSQPTHQPTVDSHIMQTEQRTYLRLHIPRIFLTDYLELTGCGF